MRADIEEMMKGNNTCVLATVSGGSPHCSLMSYALSDDCRELYLVTQKNTKKYGNMKENPDVSLLVDSREADRSVGKARTRALTVTGRAEIVADERKRAVARKRLLMKHPHLQDFMDQPEIAIVLVKVTAWQLLDGLTDAYFETVAE